MSTSIDNTDNNYINIAYQKSVHQYQQYRQQNITRRQYQYVVRSMIPSLNDVATRGYIRINQSKFEKGNNTIIIPETLKVMISKYARTQDTFRDELD